MGKKTYVSSLVNGFGGKMSKRIYNNCPNINKLGCLISNNTDNNITDNTNNTDNNITTNNIIDNNNTDNTDNTTNDFIVLYTFDMPSNEDLIEHSKMLVMSILSCIREFNTLLFKIIIYTTTVEPLKIYLTNNLRVRDMNYIKIVNYLPSKYGAPKLLGLQQPNYDPFISGIGHARVFIIDELRRSYKCPIVYMDNDTGIQLDKGFPAFLRIMDTATITFYCLETWLTFNTLYDKIGLSTNLFSLKTKYPDTININCTPRNNGILIYGYNDANNTFINDAITLIKNIYIDISSELQSHYNDMFAFSLACEKLNINDFIFDISFGNNLQYDIISQDIIITDPTITITEQPIFVHYYINKYLNLSFINYVFDEVLRLYNQDKTLALNNDEKVTSSNFLLNKIFTNSDSGIIDIFKVITSCRRTY